MPKFPIIVLQVHDSKAFTEVQLAQEAELENCRWGAVAGELYRW